MGTIVQLHLISDIEKSDKVIVLHSAKFKVMNDLHTNASWTADQQQEQDNLPEIQNNKTYYTYQSGK